MVFGNVQQKYTQNAVLAAIFCFAHLKVKNTKSGKWSYRFELNTSKLGLCRNKRKKKSALKCRAKLIGVCVCDVWAQVFTSAAL